MERGENVAFLILQKDGADSFITCLCWWLYSVIYLRSCSKPAVFSLTSESVTLTVFMGFFRMKGI